MKLSQLEYFQTVCRHNNLTRAAEELHISQPGLTHVIHELEQEFGLTLFLRQNKGLVLTEEGRQFLNEANLLLEQTDRFISRMKFLGQSKQVIQLGLPPASATLLFPPIMQQLHRMHPQLKVNIVENGSLMNHQQVLDGKLDIAMISTDAPMSAAFGHYKLTNSRICLYLSREHPLAKADSLSLREICQIPLVMLTEDSFLTTNTLKTCARHKLTPQIILNTNQIAIIRQFVESNTAGTLLFHDTIPESDRYRAIEVPEFAPVYIYLIWNQYNPLSAAVKEFIRAAKAAYPCAEADFYYTGSGRENLIL